MTIPVAYSRQEAEGRSSEIPDFPMRLVKELTHRPPDSDPADAISPRFAEMLLELVVERSHEVENVPNYHKIQHRFIESVLRDPNLTEADILRGGQLFGIDFTRPRAVILVGASSYILGPDLESDPDLDEARILQRAKNLIKCVVSYFSLPRDTICAYIGNGEIAILKASSSRDLAGWVEQRDRSDWGTMSWANLDALKRATAGLLSTLKHETRTEIAIGIGRYHPGIHGLARSYQDARAALSLGLQFEGPNQVHCLDQLGIASFVGVADDRTKVDLSAHLLSPLDHAPELIETLEAFFAENCCPSSTASRLEIHRNTLRYRLDKITSLTGLDPRIFDHAVQIRLALVVRLLNQPHR
jgi:carbohydrate diacid regulator